MIRARTGRVALCLATATLATFAACGHTAAIPRPAVHRVWPAPPAHAQVQWLAEFPNPRGGRDHDPSMWSNLWRWVSGASDEQSVPQRAQLVRPFGVAATGTGFVVVDPDASRVLRVTWPGDRSVELECAAHPWQMPMSVAVAPDGAVYVADGSAGVVVRIAVSGRCALLGASHLERPTGVALAGDRLYVVDPPQHRVVVFAVPSGDKLFSFGRRGDASGAGMNFPTAIATTANGELLVVDALNFRVSRFGRAGTYRDSFGQPGRGGGAFARPKAVAVDPAGRLFVSDADNDVVVAFAPSGEFLFELGGSGSGPGDLLLPAGVAIRGGLLFVADSQNHRVNVYRLLTEAF